MTKPPWDCNDKQMERWVNEQLGEREHVVADQTGLDAFEIYAADHGDIEPLKKKYPHLAPYLRLPKRARGKRFENPHREMVERAAAEVALIRVLWEKEYGKRNRRRGEISAEQIAARRWDVEAEEVYQFLKAEPDHWRAAKWYLEYGHQVGRWKNFFKNNLKW